MKKMIILAASLLLVLNGNPAIACSCIPTTPRRSYQQARAVFAGRVIDVVVRSRTVEGQRNNDSQAERLFEEVKITFEVSRVWKGATRRQIVITTANSSASCGYNFEKGKEYLVYASGQRTELTTGLCSGTKLLSGARSDLTVLGQGSTVNTPENTTVDRLQPGRGL